MNFNIFLLRLGLDPNNFKNKLSEPIQTEKGFIYEIEQREDIRICPFCNSKNAIIWDHYFTTINTNSCQSINDILRIRKTKFKCKDCGKLFTMKINGIDNYSVLSNQAKQLILNECLTKKTFSDIGKTYNISTARVVQLFDKKFPIIPRSFLPEVLCVDEIHFSKEIDQKYCCVISDFNNRTIVDIIKNRQLPYLRGYFSSIPENERLKVKIFISDMYDGYATIHDLYFKSSLYVVDLFHVIKQLTEAVNIMRTRVMNLYATKGSKEYNFMKGHWKEFLCKKSNIKDKFYTYKNTGEIIHYDDIVFSCLKLNSDLLEAYSILQELYTYTRYYTFTEALNFIERISNRLHLIGNPLFEKVGQTYHRWRIEIANGFARNQKDVHYTNAIAESLNNGLKTIIKDAYGYQNFERFRKRALLISTYSKYIEKGTN